MDTAMSDRSPPFTSYFGIDLFLLQAMTLLHVQVRYVDGSCREVAVPPDFLDRYKDYARRGYKGKELIDKLWSDDLGVTPLSLKIVGTDAAGHRVDVSIPYV